MAHQQEGQQRERQHLQAQQQGVAQIAGVVLAEEVEVEHQAQQDDDHVEHLSQQLQTVVACRLLACCLRLVEALQDLVHLFGHDVAAVDDVLSRLHIAGAGDHGVLQVFQQFVGLALVEQEIALDEEVQVQLFQLLLVHEMLLGTVEDVFVG